MKNPFWTQCLVLFTALFNCQSYAHEQAIDKLDQVVTQMTTGNIATTVVLTDANLITLGVVNFDPNEFLHLGHLEAGSESSLQHRRELTRFSLPWKSDWSEVNFDWKTQSLLKLAYINSNQSVAISDDSPADKLKEKSYLLMAEQRWKYALSDHWQLLLGISAQAVWYENNYDYQSIIQLQRFQLDKRLLNTSYGALLLDPSIELRYDNVIFGHKWQFISGLRYAMGQTLLTDTAAQNINSKTGRLSNALLFHYELPSFFNDHNELRFMFKRIDLTGDAVAPMGTDHYYEVGAGWLFNTPSLSGWLENIGVGVTINAGSALSGGSVVILFNEDI